MPPFTQANRPLTITTPLGTDVFGVSALSGAEAISRPFEFRVDVFAAADATVEFDRLLGQGVTVSVALPEGEKRHFNGIVRSVAKGGTERTTGVARTAYRLTLVPKLWLLTRVARSRIFQQKTVKQILETVLTGITTQFTLQGTYEPRDYCAQYRETDFEFASRLMEEEGIFYFFTHADGQHKMVIGDVPIAHPVLAAGPTIKFDPGSGGALPDDRIHEWEKSQELTAGKVTLWDHCFELPGRNLEATAQVLESVQVGEVAHKVRYAANQQLELYDFPGGYAKRFDGVAPGGGDAPANINKIFQDNARTVGIRTRQVAVGALVVTGSSNCRQLVAGHKFTLTDHLDGDGEYVLTAVEHEARAADTARSGGGSGFAYRNRFRCIPSALPFQTPRVTPRPRVDGCQTATVVGPSGEEIFTDKYGRVKVQFHWDREGQRNASSSCWVRVATIWAGNQWGAIHIPRIGQEVVVDFLEGDPDRPIIVGSVYNAQQMPPYALPANRTQSGIKSRSSAQGGPETFNEIRFEDKKGSEHVFIQAEKDLRVNVKNDETWTTGHDRTETIQHNHKQTITEGDQRIEVVKGNQEILVKEGDQTMAVKLGKQVMATFEGPQIMKATAGDQTFRVEDGDRKIIVETGDQTTTIGGARSATVGKDDKLEVSKKLTIEAGDEIVLKTGQSQLTMKKDGTIILKGMKIQVEATATIEMKAAKVAVAAQGQAEVKAAMVKIEGQGMLQMKAPMSQLNGDGLLMAKGGLTMIN